MLIASDLHWTDYGGFWATVGGVAVTLAAVLVALFGQRYNAWRRRPRLSVRADPLSVSYSPYDSVSEHVMYLSIHNEEGRDTARDVEVFADAHAIDMPELRRINGVNLNFDDALVEGLGRSTATVPAGYSRRVSFAIVRESLPDTKTFGHEAWVHIAVYPPRGVPVATVWDGLAYQVDVTVTGANFDAIFFRGIMGVWTEPEDEPQKRKTLRWKEEPHVVKATEPPAQSAPL
jgi:hypothetical protein